MCPNPRYRNSLCISRKRHGHSNPADILLGAILSQSQGRHFLPHSRLRGIRLSHCHDGSTINPHLLPWGAENGTAWCPYPAPHRRMKKKLLQ